MKPVYETSFELWPSDADFLGTWRPSAIFTAMQELGELHSMELGMGYRVLRPMAIGWVVTRTLLEIDRAPVIGETIRARTWPGKPRHAVYPRYYAFDDADGRPLARASTLWVLMDVAAREMITAESRGLPPFDAATLPPPIENPGGIPRLDGPAAEMEREIAYGDLDVNRHVNNARYVDWLCDRFPCAWHEKNRLRRLLVHFTSETRPDEPLRTLLTTDGPAFTFSGGRDGRAHFAMGGRFAPR